MIGRWLGVLALAGAVCACGKSTSNSESSANGGSSGASSDDASGGSSSTNVGTGTDSEFVVDQFRDTTIDKMDVLFVVDNSISMADKQELFSRAVPWLIERLANPDCVQTDADGRVVAREPATGSGCPDDFRYEFNPLDDVHIGVITSSLGGHGGDVCSEATPASWNPSQNDRGHLMPTVRPDLDLPSDDPAGFLAWQGGATGRSREDLKAAFAEHVRAAGEVGCGYEATLEAWYRFLIDPTPAQDMLVIDNVAVPSQDADGIIVDATVLAQREAFLRPDSLVAIVMLTDENDCSVVDGGIGWLTAAARVNDSNFTMPLATTACDENPNDPCCQSCGVSVANAGCSPIESDANCAAGDRPIEQDALNLRCYNQKQRFGFDLLYPIERYVSGLRDPQVYDTKRCDDAGACPLVPNPLFSPRGASVERDPGHVFLAGIVGVPWQDIATEASLDDPERLEYMTAVELSAEGRWQMILGEPEAANPLEPSAQPTDPLMIEHSDPRTGTHPVTGEPLASETSTDPGENSINGHEYVNDDNGDLQYACIFPLAESRDCSDPDNIACDCTEDDLPSNKPLCNPPEGGEAALTQYYAKAYPGRRLLHTLRNFGDNSIVASICPKVTDPDAVEGGDQHPVYGYNPAIAALVDRAKVALGGRCMPRSFDVDESGKIACTIVEATLRSHECEEASGRSEVEDAVAAAVAVELTKSGSCGGASGIDCDSYSLCHVNQLSADAHEDCLNRLDYPSTSVPGFCYIDADQNLGNEALLVGCPETEQRRLRFVGNDTPRAGSITFIVCDTSNEE